MDNTGTTITINKQNLQNLIILNYAKKLLTDKQNELKNSFANYTKLEQNETKKHSSNHTTIVNNLFIIQGNLEKIKKELARVNHDLDTVETSILEVDLHLQELQQISDK